MNTLNCLFDMGTYIMDSVDPFTTAEFFISGNNGIAILSFDHVFQEKIIKHASPVISTRSGSYRKFKLTKCMNDTDIRNELRHPLPMSIDEFLARTKDAISRQPLGQPGFLDHFTVFHVMGAYSIPLAVFVRFNVVSNKTAPPEWNFFCKKISTNSSPWPTGNAVIIPKIKK